MKRFTLFAVLGFCLAVPSLVMAQSEYNHAEVGVFADYFRFSTPNPNINFVGVGGRIAANVHPNIRHHPGSPVNGIIRTEISGRIIRTVPRLCYREVGLHKLQQSG